MISPRNSLRTVKNRRFLDTLDDSDDEGPSHLVLSARGMSTLSSSEYSDTELAEACLHFSIVGVGYLFPFSALTQPVDYWDLLFPDFNIEFPLTTVYMYTNLVCLSLLVFLGGTPKFTQRIVGGFVGQLIVLVFVPTSYFFHLHEQSNEYAVLGATAFAAVVTAFIDSSVIALAAQYPLRVQEYFQFGVGLSTLIGSIYRDVTKIIFPPEMTVESSLLYFYSGAATIALCIASYYRLMQLDISKKCLARAIAEEEKHHHETVRSQAAKTEKSLLLPTNQNDSTISLEPDKWIVLRKVFFNESMVLLLFMSTCKN